MLGQVPAAALSVYQEKAFGKAKVNVIHMMAWSSLSQFAFLILFFPFNFIPGFGGIPPGSFLDYFKNAGICVVQSSSSPPECQGAGLWLALSTITMLLAQAFQALVIKHSSATLAVLLMTLIIPLSAICFTLSFIMGENVEHFNITTLISLIVVILGIVVYRFVRFDQYPFSLLGFGKDLVSETSPLMQKCMPVNLDEEELVVAPVNLSSRIGIIELEYTAKSLDPRNILYENTIPPNDENSEFPDTSYEPVTSYQ